MMLHHVAAAWLSAAVVAAVLAFAIIRGEARNVTASDTDIDHVILGIDNLARGIEQFTTLTGVAPKPGGQHPGRGTENALVGLGDARYLEILAPVGGSIGPDRAARVAHARLTPTGWALHTRDLAALVERVRRAGFTVSGPSPGSRRQPDGSLLEWQTATVRGPDLAIAPFFIQWADRTPHPSTTSPGGCRLIALDLTDPQPARLEEFFRAAGFHATVRTGSTPGMRLTLECPHGRVTFPEGRLGGRRQEAGGSRQ